MIPIKHFMLQKCYLEQYWSIAKLLSLTLYPIRYNYCIYGADKTWIAEKLSMLA